MIHDIERLWAELTVTKAASFLAGAFAVGYLIAYCWKPDPPYLMLLALLGGISGFILGIVAAPLTKKEAARFSEVGKVVSTFLSGYILSKLDPIITALVTPRNGLPAPITAPPAAEQVMVTLAGAGLAFLFVLGARLYWMPVTAAEKR